MDMKVYIKTLRFLFITDFIYQTVTKYATKGKKNIQPPPPTYLYKCVGGKMSDSPQMCNKRKDEHPPHSPSPTYLSNCVGK